MRLARRWGLLFCARRGPFRSAPLGTRACGSSRTVARGVVRMHSRSVNMGIAGLIFVALGTGVGLGVSQAQPGVAERVGEKLDNVARGLVRGAQEVTEGVRKKFEVVRTDVSRMG